MKKTCVFLIGGNLAGKSTVARALAEKLGGLRECREQITWLGDGNSCMAGIYKPDSPHGGVDRLNNTAVLRSVVERGLKDCDLIICEGSFLDTFGNNLTNAIFAAKRQLVVHLWCTPTVLYQRQQSRPNHYGEWDSIIKKHQRVARVSAKWASIGVPVLRFNTAEKSPETIADEILKHLQ